MSEPALNEPAPASAPAQDPASKPSGQSEPSAFTVPDAYKDRGWVEKVKSPDDLWKALDNAQSALGKRPSGIPANDAPVEEWTKFYDALRPKDVNDYELPKVDGVPDGMFDAKQDAIKKMMHDNGLTKKQASDLWKQYVGMELEAAKATNTDLDKRYDENLTKTFGDKKSDIEKLTQDAIKLHVSAERVDAIIGLADRPESLVAIMEMANNYEAEIAQLRKEYGAEGGLPSGEGRSTGESIEETSRKLAKLRLSDDARDFTKPKHKETLEEINRLAGIVQKHYNRA